MGGRCSTEVLGINGGVLVVLVSGDLDWTQVSEGASVRRMDTACPMGCIG